MPRLGPLLALLATLALIVACGEESDPEKDVNPDTESDDDSSELAEDVPSDLDPTTVSGEDRLYRFKTLELSEPKVAMRILLNAAIDANMNADPMDPLAVHIVLQARNWDLSTSPVSLEVAGGAGQPDTSQTPVAYAFRADAEPAYVPAELRPIGAALKIQNDEPTNLLFPVRISDDEFVVPLRDIRFDICYGGNNNCTSTDETLIYGTLAGGVIEEEADLVTVEFQPGNTMGLGDVLRDPIASPACASDADCAEGRECDAQSRCVRKPDMQIDGKDAYSLTGRFIGEQVPVATP